MVTDAKLGEFVCGEKLFEVGFVADKKEWFFAAEGFCGD